jgi:hypothetical protein
MCKLNLIRFTLLFTIILINMIDSKSQTCDQLRLDITNKTNEMNIANQKMTDAATKNMNINNPTEFKRHEQILKTKQDELQVLFNLFKQNGCNTVNENSQSSNVNSNIQTNSTDKAVNITNAAATGLTNIANTWENANERIYNINYQAPSMAIDNGSQTASKISNYNKDEQAKNIFKSSNNLDEGLTFDEPISSNSAPKNASSSIINSIVPNNNNNQYVNSLVIQKLNDVQNTNYWQNIIDERENFKKSITDNYLKAQDFIETNTGINVTDKAKDLVQDYTKNNIIEKTIDKYPIVGEFKEAIDAIKKKFKLPVNMYNFGNKYMEVLDVLNNGVGSLATVGQNEEERVHNEKESQKIINKLFSIVPF